MIGRGELGLDEGRDKKSYKAYTGGAVLLPLDVFNSKGACLLARNCLFVQSEVDRFSFINSMTRVVEVFSRHILSKESYTKANKEMEEAEGLLLSALEGVRVEKRVQCGMQQGIGRRYKRFQGTSYILFYVGSVTRKSSRQGKDFYCLSVCGWRSSRQGFTQWIGYPTLYGLCKCRGDN